MTAGRDPVAVAALQYCAAGTAEETLRTLMPLIDRAADDGAKLVCLPEAAAFLAASRAALADEAEPAGESMVLDRLCNACLLYTSPSPRDATLSRMPSSA